MVAQVDPSFGSLSTAEQVIALVRQNADLQVLLASYKEAGQLQQRLAEKEQVTVDRKVTPCVLLYCSLLTKYIAVPSL